MSICQATTNKGVKCNRIIKDGKYCWQHQKCVEIVTPTPSLVSNISNTNELVVRRTNPILRRTNRIPVKTILPVITKDYCLIPDRRLISFEPGKIINDGLIIMLSAHSVTDKSIRPFLFKEPLDIAERIVNLSIADLNLGQVINKYYDGNIVRIMFQIDFKPKITDLEAIVNEFGPKYLSKDIRLNETHDLYLELEGIEFYENASLTNLLVNRC
jgi:hypothetical protein